MGNNSLFLKFSKSNLALILVLIALISSLSINYYAINYLRSEVFSDYYIKAIELDEKPLEFVPYSEIDSFGIQTIFNTNVSIEISLEDFYEINVLLADFGTSNVEFGGNYYKLQFDFDQSNRVEPWTFIYLLGGSNLVIIISGVLLVVILIVRIRLYFLKR